MNLSKWLRFWTGQTSPLHRYASEEHYRDYGSELRLLLGGRERGRVLEIGCGNGALFPHLGFASAAEYTGVDFSESMLEEFRQTNPGARLVCAPGHSYREDRQYDLIFSNGVVQYFNRKMMRTHVNNAAQMLSAEGMLVCASVPWCRLRWAYCRGDAMPGASRRSVLASLKAYARRCLSDPMGRWLDVAEFRELACANSMHADFWGCLHYPYRFHARIFAPQADSLHPLPYRKGSDGS